MIIGNLLYSLDIKPGDIEKLQAKLETLQNSVEKKARVSAPIDTAATKDAMEGIRGLRNEVNSLNGEFASGQMNAKQYAAELTRIRDAAVAQMQSMLAAQGATARTTTEYARLAGIAGNTSLMLGQMGAAQNKVTMGQQLLLGATRALRFQLVRLGPVGYGTSIMFTSMAASMAGVSAGSVGLAGKVERLKATIFGLNNVIMLSGVLALVSLGVAAFRASRAIISIENAQAEVARTTNFTSDELWELTGAFQAISVEIGSSTNDLLEIAAVAGQLGIRGVKNIAEFSDTLARLALVTDIVGETGATQLARFLNITGTEMSAMGREALIAGNIINELGNTTAASAGEILKMSSEIAQVRAIANISRPDIIAIGATLKSVGISAELAGTNLTKIFDKMINASLGGGEALNTWSRAAGTTADRFRELVKENPTDALQQLALGLRTMKDNGVELLPILNDLGFKNIRERRIIAGLVLGYDILNGAREDAARQVAILNGELDEQASIDAELERRMNTISFQWRRFAAQIGVVLQVIGEGLLPHLRAMVDGLIDGRDKVVIIGSSIVTLIDTLIYLGQIFRGTGQIILGFAAGVGGALGELSVQLENFMRPMENIAVRWGNLQAKLEAGTATSADWFNLAGIKINSGDFDGEAIGAAYVRHSQSINAGMQTIIIAVEEYWAALARIPETQAKMMGTLTELTNNVEDALLRGELLDMLDEWEEEIEGAGEAPRDVMEELARTLEALDRFAESYREIDPNYDNTSEKVSALTSALRALSESGLDLTNTDVRTVIGLLQDLGVELDDLLAKARELDEQATSRYLRNLELDLTRGTRTVVSVVEELRLQEQKLQGYLDDATNYDDADSILTRLTAIRDMIKELGAIASVDIGLSYQNQAVQDNVSASAPLTGAAAELSLERLEAEEAYINAARRNQEQAIADDITALRDYTGVTAELAAERAATEAAYLEAARRNQEQAIADDIAGRRELTGAAAEMAAELADERLAAEEAYIDAARRNQEQAVADEIAARRPLTGAAAELAEERLAAEAAYLDAARRNQEQAVQDEIAARQPLTGAAAELAAERLAIEEAYLDAARRNQEQAIQDEIAARGELTGAAADMAAALAAVYTDTMNEYVKVAGEVTAASGLAASIYDSWRASIWAAAAATGELTDEMRELLELIDRLEEQDALMQLKNDIQNILNSTGDFVAGFRAFQNGDIETGIKKTGGAIAEIVGLMKDVPGVGAMFVQAFEIIVSLLGDMSNGVKQVRAEIEDMQKDFTFFDASDLVVTEQVSRGGLLGLLGMTKESIDQDLTELNVNIAQAIESGMRSGFTSGIREFMISGVWDDLSLVVKDALLSGLIEGYLQGEAFKQMFGDALAAYIKDPSKENAEAVLAGIPAFEEFWEQVRADWGDFFGDLDTSDDEDFQELGPYDPTSTSMVAPLPSINPIIAAPSWLMEMGSHVTRFGGYVDQLTTEGIRVNVNQGVGSQSMKVNSARTATR